MPSPGPEGARGGQPESSESEYDPHREYERGQDEEEGTGAQEATNVSDSWTAYFDEDR